MKWFLFWQITSQTCIQRKWLHEWWVNSVKRVDLSLWVDLTFLQSVKTHGNTEEARLPCDASHCSPSGLWGRGPVPSPRTVQKRSKQLCKNTSKNISRSCKNTHHTTLIDYMPLLNLFTIMRPTTFL